MKLRVQTLSLFCTAVILALLGSVGAQAPLPPDSRSSSNTSPASSLQQQAENVELVGQVEIGSATHAVTVQAGGTEGHTYAYVVVRHLGLRVIDVSIPADPTEVSFFDTPGYAGGLYVAGGYAYVADGSSGLRVIDVSDPAAPVEVGFVDTTNDARDVYVADGFAYVGTWDSLEIIDISDPTSPAEVGSLSTPGSTRTVYVAGRYAYVAADYAGLRIIDVTNPTDPVEVGAYPASGWAAGVYVTGGLAHITDAGYGLRVIDVSDPTDPRQVGVYYMRTDRAYDVFVAGDLAYVAFDAGGLQIINVSDPTAPVKVGSFDAANDVLDVYIADSYVYVADSRGLLILRYTGTIPTPTPSPTGTPIPSPTSSVTPSATATHTVAPTDTVTDTPSTSTPTATSTATSRPTQTPTPTATPTATTTPSSTPGDGYEPDDACTTANAIPTDGDPQEHNFHVAGDPDWLRFQATAGTDYVISALQAGDNAHPVIRLYAKCDETPIADSSDNFGYDQIITFRAERDGLYYLKLTHRDSNAYGDDTAYQVSVRPGTTGAAIVAGGRQYPNEQFQQQITFMTDRAYRILHQAGYEHDDIYYMSADPDPPPHMDSPSLPDVLRYAIETWAPQRVQDGDPLYLYLADHGDNEYFSLNPGQDDKITSVQLDGWLRMFEAQRPHSPVVVIIEACRSGSFITPPGTVSQPRLARAGRVVVTATGDNNDAFAKPPGQGGAYFSDAFFGALAQNYDLWKSYQIGRQTVAGRWGDVQTPWIDGNGNGLPYPLDPDDEGAGRGLGLGRVAGLSGQAPFIEQPTVPQPDGDTPVLVQVKVLDEILEGITVWMEVTTPSTPPPSAPPGYITPISHAEQVELRYNPDTGLFETEFLFDERGRYQFAFHAEDAGGQRAQPVSVTTTAGGAVYLPLLARQ